MSLPELTGTIVPLVTPFNSDESFDRTRMSRLIDFILEQGADALMATALTGEASLLTVDETLTVWDTVFEKAANRIPVVPAIISTTTRQAVFLAKAAEARGAGVLMAVPILPELYAGRSYDDVYAFYADVAAATPLPLILFNYPSLTGIDFVPALVRKARKDPNRPLHQGKHRRYPAGSRPPAGIRRSDFRHLRRPECSPRIPCLRLPGLDHGNHEYRSQIRPPAFSGHGSK